MNDIVRMLATWALVHETADEAWKAAVARGRQAAGGPPGDFTDALAALVDEEKARLKAGLAAGHGGGPGQQEALGRRLDALAFEIAELRGRLETLQVSIDALLARGDG